jgi:methyltransferase (TIGR00027 family)
MNSDLCSLLTVGGFRYLQNSHEEGPYKNPDNVVHHFLDEQTLRRAREMQGQALGGLSANPFYNYLLLRTRHYDDALVKAVESGIRQVVILGSGTDTRAYRFRQLLETHQVATIECDQASAIHEKELDARRLGECRHVRFTRMDIHATSTAEWQREAGYDPRAATLILAEGVTPYVLKTHFLRWLEFFAENSGRESRLSCDYKVAGCDDAFGRLDAGPTLRIPRDSSALVHFHRRAGWEVSAIERAEDLSKKHHECWDARRPIFDEDIVVNAVRV